ncbi:MAG: VacJ family lipoprotein [Deltaproteobacteria bacterium]|jgi:phospholipid-binding lipoprotein MlaA|nr:VacJ family lipoprotein [Deltaproteobacteria bacterium]
MGFCGGDPAPRTRLAALAAIAAALSAGIACAPVSGPRDPSDPWERMNRGTFRFNEGLDRWVIEPVAKGVDFALPDPVERSIAKFFVNSRIPIHFGNALLQFKPVSAVEDLARFLVNSTIGFAGFFDPASHIGLEAHQEDFGQTLGVWGVPAYPYLVLPIFGPSSPRDAVGLAADSFSTVYPWFVPLYVPFAIGVGDRLNWRSLKLDEIASEREAALDYYVAVRNAYLSYRENQVRDQKDEVTDDEDLYYID